MKHDFWDYLQKLVNTNRIMIDRPRNSTHHRYPDRSYPVEYGFLDGTTSMDSGGEDIGWDLWRKKKWLEHFARWIWRKKDTKLKIIYDCTDSKIQAIRNFVNCDQMRAIFV
jgi:inorganic pyrophosphatase